MLAQVKVIAAAGLLAALGTVGISGSAIATASGSPGSVVDVSTPAMLDSDGTQGSFAPAVQGTQDSDGDQDAHATGSFEAVPQGVHK